MLKFIAIYLALAITFGVAFLLVLLASEYLTKLFKKK